MPRMLIVDDDLHLRKLVLTYARMENYQCREAESGEQALALLREAEADIIILDVMMPGKDGFETLEELRQFTQAPVIMLTARGEEYDKLLGFHLGADDYVSKPFSPKELMARVGAVLDDLKTEDLAYNEQLLSSLSRAADGKLLIVNGSGQLIDLYTLGHPIDLRENRTDILEPIPK